MECVHQLMSTTFVRYAASFTSGAVRRSLLEAGLRLSSYDPAPLGALADLSVGGDADAGGAGESAVGEGSAASGGGDATDWAAVNAKYRKLGVQFWTSGQGCLGKLMLQRMLLEPLRAYLAAQFDAAGAPYERRENAKLADALQRGELGAQARRYPICEAASGRTDCAFHAQVQALFQGAQLWSVVPPRSRTVSFRALAFRGASRQACAFHEVLGRAHCGFPHQTFRLVSEQEAAQALDKVPECLLDSWSRKMKRTYGFDSAIMRHVLSTLADSMSVDISKLEAKRASVRRLLTALSVQTHATDIAHVSALWVLTQRRRAKGRKPRGAPRKPKGQPSKPAARKGGRHAKKRRASGQRNKGSAFNAYTRLCTLGTLGRPDMKVVAERYRVDKVANSPLYQRALALSKTVGKGRQRLGRGRGGFGPKTAEVRRSALQRQRSALATLAAAASVEAQEDMVCKHIVEAGGSASTGLALARGARMHRAKRLREEEAQDYLHIAKYQAGVGAEVLRPFLEARPLLRRANLAPMPSAHGCMARLPELDGSAIAKAFAWCSANDRSSPLASNIDRFWEAMHHLVPHNEGDQFDVPTDAETRCWQAGVCICKRGCLVQAMVERVNAFLKKKCPRGSPLEKRLAHSSVVLALRSFPKEDGVGDAGGVALGGASELWLHIGYHTFSPYGPTYMQVIPVPDIGECPPSERRVYVQTTHRYYTTRQAMSLLPSSNIGRLEGRLFFLEESEREVRDVAPHTVPALRMASSADWELVWPAQKAKTSGKARGSGDEPAGEEGEGADGEAHDDEGDPFYIDGVPVAEAVAALLLTLYDLEPPPLDPARRAPFAPAPCAPSFPAS